MFQRTRLAFAAVLCLGQVAQAQTEKPGPRGPVGPQASIACKGVTIATGADIQAAVKANPAGTTFCLAAGTYTNQHVRPKAGDKFIGAVGTILDGGGKTNRAFVSTSATTNVTVQNLIVQNYIGGYQVPAIDGQNAIGWRILNNEVRQNDGVGVAFAGSTLVQFNYIHHNLESGYVSNPGSGILLVDNEIAFNNYTDKYDCNDECGGGKLWATNGAVVNHNYSHDNHGPGLWDDFNNNAIAYSWNRIENNYGAGIHHEIGYNATIHDNVILNNGSKAMKGPTCNWLWCAGISIAASGGVGDGGSIEIFNNTITPGSQYGNAIGLVQQNRSGSGEAGKPSMGAWHVQNVWVHDNTIDLSKGGNIGGVQDENNNGMFIASVHNNRFDLNHYILGTNTKGPFWWNNKEGNKAFWQSQGMDLNGTFQ